MEPGQPPIRLIVIADDPLVRAGLASALEESVDIRVMGQFSLSELQELDLDLPRAEIILIDQGWGAADEPSYQAQVDLPVLRMVDPAEPFSRARSRGGSVISREASPEQIGIALQAVLMGLIVFDPHVTHGDAPARDELEYEALTAREQEVLEYLADGLTNRAISNQLKISENTVKFHVNSILSKLNAQSRTEAVMIAARAGLIPL